MLGSNGLRWTAVDFVGLRWTALDCAELCWATMTCLPVALLPPRELLRLPLQFLRFGPCSLALCLALIAPACFCSASALLLLYTNYEVYYVFVASTLPLSCLYLPLALLPHCFCLAPCLLPALALPLAALLFSFCVCIAFLHSPPQPPFSVLWPFRNVSPMISFCFA